MLYINDEPVGGEEIDREVARLRAHYERTFADKPRAEREVELREWSRENVIERVLLRQAARRDPERVPRDLVDRRFRDMVKEYGGRRAYFEYLRLDPSAEEGIKRGIALEIKVARLCDRVQKAAPAPSEERIRAYFEAHPEEFTVPELVRAAHIVKHAGEGADRTALKAEMEAIRARIAAGEDFEALAREHSDCPDGGGDLGYFPRGQMLARFDDVVFGLEVGGVSSVFETEMGVHIAKLLDKRPACPGALEDVRDRIAAMLAKEAGETALEDFIDAEKAGARIEER